MISVFGWPDPNTGFDQSEHASYTCYFIIHDTTGYSGMLHDARLLTVIANDIL